MSNVMILDLDKSGMEALLRGMFNRDASFLNTEHGQRSTQETAEERDTYCKMCDPDNSDELEYELSNGDSAYCWVGESHLILHDGINSSRYEQIPIRFCPFCGKRLVSDECQ